MAANAMYRRQGSWGGLLALLALICPPLAGDLFAQGRQLFGKHDFELEWRLEPAGKLIRARFLAEKRLLRLEALDGSGEALIRDLAGGGVLVLVDEGRRGVYAGQGRPAEVFSGQPEARIREVAGESCRDFSLGRALICLSDDGIPLLVEEEGGAMNTLRIIRQAQNPALFLAPKDVKPKPLPAGSGLTRLPF